MASLNTFVILLLSLATVILVLTCAVIFKRIRQAPTAPAKPRFQTSEESHRDPDRRPADKAEEQERQQAEAERHRPEEDLHRAEQQLQKAKEEPSHLEQKELRKTEGEHALLEEEPHKVEEERKRLHEKAQQKAETPQHQTEDLQTSAEGQCHREAAEAPHTVGQHQVAEEEHREVEKIESRRKPLEPAKRGGRPRTATYYKKAQISQEARPRTPKPEVICRKRERQWILAVEIPGELLGTPNLEVLQGGKLLRQDESCEDCWLLNDAYGQVVVKWNAGQNEVRLADEAQSYLLFKLSGQHKNQGRRVTSCSSGSYLVVVPEDWQRDDAISGPPPVAPEPVSLPEFSAHFFELGKDADSKIAFLTPSGLPVIITPKATRFRLVGTQLNDASEGIGPLFGERPPKICALDDQAWRAISTIVIGEEGEGRGRWRTQMTPVPDVLEQDLPSEVADRKGGWYFVRFYDTNDDLIESLDFRFLSALKDIRVPQPPPFPSQAGHQPISVEFLHEPGCTVQPADGSTNMQIVSQHDKTTLIIPPEAAYDETRWVAGPEDGPQVELTILVERLWWAVGEEDLEPSKWVDRPVTLGREDFAATSKQALWLRLPRRRWVDKVHVGFERWKARPYDVRVTEKTIAIPLREYGDSVEDRTRDYFLKIWLKRDSEIEGAVAVIPVSPSAASPVAHPTLPQMPQWVGLGRKKTAKAKAVLRQRAGDIRVNGYPQDEYFKMTPRRARQFWRRLLELNPVREILSRMDVHITVTGSSPTSTRQAKAAAHALARAVAKYNPKLKPLLKQAGFGGVRVKSKK